MTTNRISHGLTLLIVLTAFGSAEVRAQVPVLPDAQYTAPVAWTEYKVPSQKISVMLPKLPVMRIDSNVCSQLEGRVYHAYANGVVYEFEWHARSDDDPPIYCRETTKFSRDLFTKRIADLKAQAWSYRESEATVAGRPAIVLQGTSSTASITKTRWLIWDKDRGLAVGVTYRSGSRVDEEALIGGLRLTSSTGQDIRKGADSTLGDPDPPLKAVGTGSSGIVVISKPRPSYTDKARHSNTQGTVVLRVTFLSNGGVGSISPTKELPDGLTEQAIAAARKIAFLPAIADGLPITVTKQVEYTFSIY
jgi:TonB family protein